MPMDGGQEVRVDSAVLDSNKPAVLLGILCSDDADLGAAPSNCRGARSGTIVCRETGALWSVCWPAVGGTTTATTTTPV